MFYNQATIRPTYQFDYAKLRRKLEQEGGPFWRAYYLNSTPNPPSDAQDHFHTWLKSASPNGPKFIVKLYKLKQVKADEAYCKECQQKVSLACPNGSDHRLENQQQKGVDVGIASLALIHKDRYETLVLSSGDGDLLDAVEFLSEHEGKRIELAVFKSNVSTDLQSYADHIYWIDDFAEEVRRE